MRSHAPPGTLLGRWVVVGAMPTTTVVVYQSVSGQSVSDLCRTALSHSPLGLPVRHSLLFLLLLLLLSLLVLERETRCSMAASKLAR